MSSVDQRKDHLQKQQKDMGGNCQISLLKFHMVQKRELSNFSVDISKGFNVSVENNNQTTITTTTTKTIIFICFSIYKILYKFPTRHGRVFLTTIRIKSCFMLITIILYIQNLITKQDYFTTFQWKNVMYVSGLQQS
jgi:hypothetical protein